MPVNDITQFIAGSRCTQIMADMGSGMIVRNLVPGTMERFGPG